MAKHLVHCRVCKGAFDTSSTKEGEYWVMPSRNFYYHTRCYTDWKGHTNIDAKAADEDWIDLIYDFIAHDIKKPYDYFMCEAQRKQFLSKKMTNKGIFFTLKYFYEIKKGDWEKGHGGLGIVPFVYSDACAYWEDQYSKQNDILDIIEKQMRERAARPKVSVKKKQKKQWKSQLDEIGAMADD